MSSTEPAKENAVLRLVIVGALLISGLALTGWSFVGPRVNKQNMAWSAEQAKQYQATSARLHGLSHEFAHAAEEGKEESVRAELEKAQAEYNVLRGELESAIARPRHIAWIQRVIGLLIAAGGAFALFRYQPAVRSNRDE